MGIRFIFGRAGSGKSHYCLNQIKKKLDNDKNNKLILLVPDQYTFQTEKKLLEYIGERALLRAEVLSFKRMATRVFDKCGGRAINIIEDSGKNMLIYKLLKDKGEEFKYFNRISKQQGFVGTVSKSITEFKKYNITQEILNEKQIEIKDKDLKDKINDLSSIYETFNKNLHKEYIDSDDILSILSEKLKECDLYNDCEIWIDEFTTFTPQQIEVLKTLAKQCKNMNITLCNDGEIQFIEGETDIFDVIKNTENKLLKMMQENNVSYKEPVNLNKKNIYRFKESKELGLFEEIDLVSFQQL